MQLYARAPPVLNTVVSDEASALQLIQQFKQKAPVDLFVPVLEDIVARIVAKDIIWLANMIQMAVSNTTTELRLRQLLIAFDEPEFQWEAPYYGDPDLAVECQAIKTLTLRLKDVGAREKRFLGKLAILCGHYNMLSTIGIGNVPQWPPGCDDTTEPGLLDETLAKTTELLCTLMSEKKTLQAVAMLKKIPAATIRRAIRHIPPYRADVLALLMFCANVVDPSTYIRSMWITEDRYKHLRRSPWVDVRPTLVTAWSKDEENAFPWTVAPHDAFDDQYLTLFPTRRTGGDMCIVQEAEFKLNLEAFLGFSPHALNLRKHDMVMAGGCMVACLLPTGALPSTATIAERTKYFQECYPNSDIDLFTLSKRRSIKSLIDTVAKVIGKEILVVSRARSVTIVPPFPGRRIQIHVGAWMSGAEVISHTDVDCCAVLYDGKDVQFTLRGHMSWTRCCNFTGNERLYHIRGSPTYERRLLKYARRGFAVMDLGVTADKKALVDESVRSTFEDAQENLLSTSGLLWLRTVERYPRALRRENLPPDIPKRPDMAYDDIIRILLSKGYVASDNYGTHESGYNPCTWWCRSTTISGRRVHSTWDACRTFLMTQYIRDPEQEDYLTPAWYRGIKELDPGNVGSDDEYD
jgi:hypothetical protein